MQRKEKPNPILLNSPLAVGMVVGSALFIPKSYITLGYVLVCTVGGIAYLMARLENGWVKKGKHAEADRIALVGKVLFPVVVIGAGVYLLILKNPLLYWL